MVAGARQMVHESDPAEQIVKEVGDLTGVEIFANQILLGVYKRPEKTKSGLFLSDQTRGEDEHQGKVGLVLKMGPQAFVDDDNRTFLEAERCKVGDWVVMWVTDGRKVVVNKQLCRVVEDHQIRMRVIHPDMVF